MRALIPVFVLTACGGSDTRAVDARVADAPLGADAVIADAHLDAFLPGPADAPPPNVRILGHVNLPGPGPGVTATLLSPAPPQSMAPNSEGSFFFDVPEGSAVVIRVERSDLRPMIRAWRASANTRVRQYYLLGHDEEAGVVALGHPIDESKAILEIDFRNAQIGGYGATVTAGSGAVTPGFGVAYDENGDGVTTLVTVTGGDGSTLFLGNVPPGNVDLAATVPAGATRACTPCDSLPVRLEAGAVTWYDFECGEPDCQ